MILILLIVNNNDNNTLIDAPHPDSGIKFLIPD